MGLLDDAIREHLELKRQHGGDPSEIERQAREALGTSAPQPDAPDAGDRVAAVAAGDMLDVDDAADEPLPPGAVAADPLADEEVVEAGPDDEGAEPPPSAEPPTQEQPLPDEELPRRGQEAGAPGYDEDPWLEEDEPAEEEQAQASEEDVLEETPDFLQETPEHDRLWFEQKPPRDFDWDR